MRTSAVSPARFGSLTVSAAATQPVRQAFAYLAHDAVARSLIDRLEHSRTPHRILLDHHDDDAYRPWSHVIRWDPTSALRTSRGGHQSPALGLAHEIDHAVVGDGVFLQLAGIADARFDNLEERRVILGSERHVARTLHESTRADHAGEAYRVTSPVDH